MRAVGIILTLIILASLTSLVIAGEDEGTIYLRASSNRVKVGEEFTIYVAVNTTQKIGAIDIEVGYPAELIEVKEVKCLQKGVFIEHSIKEGVLKVSMVSLSGLSSGTILDVVMESQKRGIAEFELRVIDAATPEAKPLDLRVQEGLEVLILPLQEDTPTPSPTPTATSSPTETTSSPTETQTTTTSTLTSTTTTPTATTTSASTPADNQTETTTNEIPRHSTTSTTTTPGYASQSLTTTTSSPEPTTVSTPETSTSEGQENHPSGEVAYAVFFITSTPSGAEVYLENESLGKTPLKIEVPPGNYRVKAVYGNETVLRDLNVTSGGEYTINFRFAAGASVTASPGKKESGHVCGPGLILILSLMAAVLLSRG